MTFACFGLGVSAAGMQVLSNRELWVQRSQSSDQDSGLRGLRVVNAHLGFTIKVSGLGPRAYRLGCSLILSGLDLFDALLPGRRRHVLL